MLLLYVSLCPDNKKSRPTSHISKPDDLRAPPGTRTLDTLIKSQVLYQLS